MSRRKASIKGKGVDILLGNGLPSVEGPRPRHQVQREEEEERARSLTAEAEAAVSESEEEEAEAPTAPVAMRPLEEISPEAAVPQSSAPPLPRPEEHELPEVAFRPLPPPEGRSEEEEVLKRVGRGPTASLFREIDDLYQRAGGRVEQCCPSENGRASPPEAAVGS